jgi:flagellar FliJ protein
MDAAALNLLVEMATSARDDAARAHGRRVQAFEQAKRQRTQLDAYLRDYQGRARDRMGSGLDAAAAVNQRAFLARLDQAVLTQQQDLKQREAEVARSAAQLAEEGRKLERMRLLQTRRAQDLLARDNRRDQRLMDEIAQRSRPDASASSHDGTEEHR